MNDQELQWDEYLEVISPEEIKVRDHRIWIEHILEEHMYGGMNANDLALRFDTLTIEQIYAVLLYYHRNKTALDKYMNSHREYCRRSREEFYRNNTEMVERMRQRKREREEARQHRIGSVL